LKGKPGENRRRKATELPRHHGRNVSGAARFDGQDGLVCSFLNTTNGREIMATWIPKFKVGATVTLNTGGSPVMSVNEVPDRSSRNYRCQWFAGKKLDFGLFNEEQLIAADPKAPVPPPENEDK
jgi:uncharacterized protein YodC (DUF2158 family)